MGYTGQKQRDFQREWSKRRAKENKESLREILEAGCVVCGENHPACMDFHHKDPAEKSFGMAWGLRHASTKRVMVEADKCIVLCRNCHAKFHAGLG